MTIQQIKYFITVAKTLSFTDSAKEHFTSQPNISRQIYLLEKELGFPLLSRNNKSVKLTPSGAIMLSHFKESIRLIDNGITASVNAANGITGELKIGYLDPFNTDLFFSDYIQPFQNKYPNIELSFTTNSFQGLRKGLDNGNLDIIFTLDFEIKNIKNVISYKIAEVYPLILMNKEHPLSKKKNLTIQDFKEETFIVPSTKDSPGRLDDVNRLLSSYGGFACKKVLYSANVNSQLMYVRSGMGVALVDTGIPEVQISHYHYFRFKDISDTMPVIAIWKEANMNPSLELFNEQFK